MFGQNQSPSPGVQKNSEELEYKAMDVMTGPAWSGATVALVADVINQLKNTVAPTSELLASPNTSNVSAGALSLQSQNSPLFSSASAARRVP
jgi:hypothetical protein